MKNLLVLLLWLVTFTQAVIESHDCHLCRQIGSNLCREGDSSSLCKKIGRSKVLCPSEFLRLNKNSKNRKLGGPINRPDSEESFESSRSHEEKPKNNKNLMDLVGGILAVAHTQSENDLRRIRAQTWRKPV